MLALDADPRGATRRHPRRHADPGRQPAAVRAGHRRRGAARVAPPARHAELLDAFASLPSSPPSSRAASPRRSPSRPSAAPSRCTLDGARARRRRARLAHRLARAHRAAAGARAQPRGLTLRRRPLADATAPLIADRRPKTSFYRRLELPFIPPELREGARRDRRGRARRAAGAGRRRAHPRRPAHAQHVERRPRHDRARWCCAAQQLGYEYVAITDHSERALVVAQACRDGRPAAARGDRRAARSGHPASTILHGIEVDIMRDGSLDFADDVLARLRHRAGVAARPRRPGRRAADRALPARDPPPARQRHHPSGQSLAGATRAGYDLDFDRLFAAAAETGTAMEIDGAPGHLDMDGALARRAVAAGVTRGHRQRLPSRRRARPADALRRRHGAARLGRAAARPQHPRRRRRPRVRRPQTCAADRPTSRSPAVVAASSRRSRSGPTRATLLPGVDLGDTGGFQAAVLWPETSARAGLPALLRARAGRSSGRSAPDNPARGLNLFSAVWGAAAVGLLAWRRRRRSRARCWPAPSPACCWRSPTRSGPRRSSPRSTRCTWRWSARACSPCSAVRGSRRRRGWRCSSPSTRCPSATTCR